jgi:hypothetical protein
VLKKNRAFEVFPVEDESFLPFCSVVPLELMVCVLEFLGYVLGFGLISVES